MPKIIINQAMFVKIIASQRWDVFWDTVYFHILFSRLICS